MATPTDPLFSSQWHFALLGDIETVWTEFTGAGVSVGVYDGAVEASHPDLDDNINNALQVTNFAGNTVTPGAPDSHGTAVAGLIAAEANGLGGVGVAHGATVTGVDIFDPSVFGFINGSLSAFLFVANQQDNFDIVNHSWGSSPTFSPGNNLLANSFDSDIADVYANEAATGRGGLGTVIVQAAGNDRLDSNGEGLSASRHTITVAATDRNGDVTDFSNFGTSVLVAAPAGSVSTDVTGAAGASSGDFTTTFGGTSASTPITSGVVALMLDADDGLGWRDVQTILAHSATLTGSGLGAAPSGEEIGAWQTNGAVTSNGGGLHVSPDYGFGMVNAYNAVRMAEVWHLFGEARTSANETSASGTRLAGVTLPDGDPTGRSFGITVSGNVEIEHVALTIFMAVDFVGDLSITVTSPSGTVIQVMQPTLALGASVTNGWQFGIDHLRGETSAGDWTVQVADSFSLDTTFISSIEIEAYGQATDPHDTYHFTDEFLTLAAQEPSRRSISDTNGGNDWLNLAAVTGNLTIFAGAAAVNGAAWFDFDREQIENIVAGDGADEFGGGTGNNHLLGMRGDDTIFGLAGDDTLEGGAGDDLLGGGGGDDSLLAGDGADLLFGAGGHDTLEGDAGNDTLGGANGNDSLSGGGGEDELWGAGGNDTLLGGEDNDLLGGAVGNDHLDGGAGHDELWGAGGDDTLLGGAGNDTLGLFTGDDRGEGGDGEDEIWGARGNDTLLGEDGDDTLGGGADDDELFGGAGRDELWGGDGHDRLEGGAQADQLGGGAGNDTMLGNDGDDTLVGGGGEDRMSGGIGGDSLVGGGGNDFLTGDQGTDTILGGAGADEFFFLPGSDTDLVMDFNAPEGDRLVLVDTLWGGGLSAAQVVGGFAALNLAGNVEFDFGPDRLELVGFGTLGGLETSVDIFVT